MNILYINHYAGSLYHGMEYRPYYLAREWVRQGHKVTILASNYSHIRNKNIEIEQGLDFIEEKIDHIDYVWFKTPSYDQNGIKRVVNIFSFLAKLKKYSKHVVEKYQPDLVIASSTYPFDTKIAAKIAKKAKAKFIYEVHDLWPLTPIEVGGMSKWHPFIMLMQRAEDYGYRTADKVVSLLPKAAQYMQEHGMLPHKFVYIPNGVVVEDWVNADQTLPDQHLALFNKLREDSRKFIIGYAGGMGEANALDYLLTSAKKVIDKPIAFVLVGNGPNKAQLKARISSENITNVHILPAIDKLQIPNFLKACDCLYIGWNKLPIYRFGICPNKLFDYMLAARPIIHSVTAGNDLVAEANCGISTEAENVVQIVDAINQIFDMSKEKRQQLAENGYDFVMANHDYPVLAKRFIDEVTNS